MASEPSRLDRWIPVLSGEDRSFQARLFRVGLWPLSWIYRLGATLQNRRFGRPGAITQVSVPVISVGNITTGGTGKTPMVQWICRRLRDQGRRVALISRGYQSTEAGVNDEALELELALPDVPHLQDPDRCQIAMIAIEELESQILVMDDGFQHRRLHRDLDIVLIDATNPWGYGYCLPRGLLREPLSGLRRADAAVITRSDLVTEQQRDWIRQTLEMHLAPGTPIATCVHRPQRFINSAGKSMDCETLVRRPAAAIAAIGNPAAFYRTLEGLGLNLIATRDFPDHHHYQRDDIQAIKNWLAPLQKTHPDLVLVATRKDLVKLNIHQIAGVPVWALEIEMQFLSGQQELSFLIDQCAENCPADTW